MAKVVSPLEGGERKNHKYIKREWKNGKWQYWYKDPAKNATDVSQLKNQNGVNATSSTERKTGDWAKAWLENKNKKSSAVGSAASVAAKVKSGKAAASKLIKTEPVYKAKTTTSPVLNSEEYKKKAEELNTEAKTKMEQNEQQYREAYEKEKKNYTAKLMNSLISKYGDAVPEEEKARIDAKVEEYTKTLWKDVYEPQVERINSAIEEANNSIQRALKRKYSDVELTHSELYHYGIPGQKWGERNGPPYPLGQKQKSSSEKNEEKNKKKIHISKEQLKTLAKVGAVVVVTGLAAYGLYRIGALDRFIGKGKKTILYSDLMKMSMKQFYAPPLHYDINRIGQKIKELEAAEPKKSLYKWEDKSPKNVLSDDSIIRIDEIMDKSRDEVLRDYGRWPLGYEESGRVLHSLNRNNLTDFELSLRFFYKPIGDYIYLVMNNFDDTYDIIDRARIPNSDTGLLERDFK